MLLLYLPCSVAGAVGSASCCCLTRLPRPVQHEGQRGRTRSPCKSAEVWHCWDGGDLVGQHKWQAISPVLWRQLFDTGSDGGTGSVTFDSLEYSDCKTE